MWELPAAGIALLSSDNNGILFNAQKFHFESKFLKKSKGRKKIKLLKEFIRSIAQKFIA